MNDNLKLEIIATKLALSIKNNVKNSPLGNCGNINIINFDNNGIPKIVISQNITNEFKTETQWRPSGHWTIAEIYVQGTKDDLKLDLKNVDKIYEGTIRKTMDLYHDELSITSYKLSFNENLLASKKDNSNLKEREKSYVQNSNNYI